MAVTSNTKLDARKLRADFPIFEQVFHGKPLAYLDSAASSQKPRQVLEAMTRFYETSYANVHAASTSSPSARPRRSRARARRCARSSTRRRPGDHLRPQRDRGDQPRRVRLGLSQPRPRRRRARHRARAPLQFRPVAVHRGAHRRRASASCRSTTTGARPRQLDGVGEGNVRSSRRIVSNSLGTINRRTRIAAWAHERGAIVVCDARAGRAAPRVDVQALGADFVAVSGHKMCGPSGIGFLWGKRSCCARWIHSSWRPHDPQGRARWTTWGELPHKFEAGTPPSPRPWASARRSTTSRRRLEAIEPRARARRVCARPARRASGHHPLRPAPTGAPASSLQRRGRPPARCRADPRPRRRRHPRRPPLLPAPDARLGVLATNRASFYLTRSPKS